MTKTCRLCGETKPLEAFHSNGHGFARKARCADCYNRIRRGKRPDNHNRPSRFPVVPEHLQDRIVRRGPYLCLVSTPELVEELERLMEGKSVLELSREMRIHERAIRLLFKRETVSEKKIDLFLTRLGVPAMWWVSPVLRPFYEAILEYESLYTLEVAA